MVELRYNNKNMESSKRILILCSAGSVSVTLVGEILSLLLPDYKVYLFMSRSAQNFISLETIQQIILPELLPYLEILPFLDMTEDVTIRCIEIIKKAAALLVIPLSANMLGRIAIGMAEDVMTSLCLLWGNNKPLVLAPAMNFMMYSNPSTDASFKDIEKMYNVTILKSTVTKFASGEKGMGGLAEPSEIAKTINTLLSS